MSALAGFRTLLQEKILLPLLVSCHLIVRATAHVVAELSKKFVIAIRKLATEKQLTAIEMDLKAILELGEVPTEFTVGPEDGEVVEFDTEAELQPYMIRTGDELLLDILG